MHRDLEINVYSNPFQNKNKNEKPSLYTNYFNHRQNIADTFAKLSKICFSMEFFTADFSQFSRAIVKNWLLGSRLGTCHKFQTFQEFS